MGYASSPFSPAWVRSSIFRSFHRSSTPSFNITRNFFSPRSPISPPTILALSRRLRPTSLGAIREPILPPRILASVSISVIRG
jgi:hypothetical protein